jgi:zinc transport system substrate-binding protein
MGGSFYMKKLLSIAIVIVLALSLLTACGQKEESNSSGSGGDEKISVVASIFPPYDFARAIAGGKAEIKMLLPPGSETHSFEPTPQDVIAIQDCDVFIYVGGDSDEWVDGVLDSMDTSKMKIVTLMDCVETVEEEIKEGMENEEQSEEGSAEGGEEEPEYDEHVWTSPRNAKLIVQKISDTLCMVDTKNAEAYKANAAVYMTRLDELDAKFKEVAANAVRKTIVFGDRFPFRYFADAYGLDYYAAFPGCSTETEASPATVKFLIDKINEEKIPVVFHIEMSNEKMADTISESTGAKVRILHAVHNVTKADYDAGKTYMDFMAANLDTLKEALN